jgi:hypothetical protein
MNLVRRILLVTAPLVGCGDASTAATGGDPSAPPPDTALLDVNPGSTSHGQPVSPRDYLEQVSGWYFAHAT